MPLMPTVFPSEETVTVIVAVAGGAPKINGSDAVIVADTREVPFESRVAEFTLTETVEFPVVVANPHQSTVEPEVIPTGLLRSGLLDFATSVSILKVVEKRLEAFGASVKLRPSPLNVGPIPDRVLKVPEGMKPLIVTLTSSRPSGSNKASGFPKTYAYLFHF